MGDVQDAADHAIEAALGDHRKGRVAEAEAVYRRVLAEDPEHPDALHLLGVSLHQRGEHAQAVELIERACRRRPGRAEYLLNLGAAYGELELVGEAERSYRAATQLAPGYARAYANLGSLLRKAGRIAEAAEWLAKAASLEPENADSWNNAGIALANAGRVEEGKAHLRRALELRPSSWEAAFNLANVLQESGELGSSLPLYSRALASRPGDASILIALGAAHQRLGHADEAEQCYRAANKADPSRTEPLNNLGNLLLSRQRAEEAEAVLRQAIAIDPGMVDALTNLGSVLRALGRTQEAEAVLSRAVDIAPSNAAALCTLGALYQDVGRDADAEGYLRRAISAAPHLAEAHNNLGCICLVQGHLGQAEASFREALRLAPDSVIFRNNLSETLKNSGRVEEAVESYRETLAREPGNAVIHSNLLTTLAYRDGISPAEFLEAAREFARRHEAPHRNNRAPHRNSRDPERLLRIGFVSGDLGSHPIGFLITDVLRLLDRTRFHVTAYSNRLKVDDMTRQLASQTDRWRDVMGVPDHDLETQIRADEIDILVDLAGHTGFNRLPVFARKPAPVQMTWLGFPATTGLDAMDYILADRYLIRDGTESGFTETALVMPGAPGCYRLPSDLPDVGPLPALRNGFITFGSFNNVAKVTPGTVALWSRILNRVPQSRMMLKYLGFGDPACQARYRRLFADHGVSADRLTFLDRTPPADMYSRYNEVDIGLDPFPYTGGTTTIISLSMGVPVLTFPGEMMASRQSFALLAHAGLTQFIARDADDLVSIATALAGDLPSLASVRESIRARLMRAEYLNHGRFVKQLERTVRDAWRLWCEASGK